MEIVDAVGLKFSKSAPVQVCVSKRSETYRAVRIGSTLKDDLENGDEVDDDLNGHTGNEDRS